MTVRDTEPSWETETGREAKKQRCPEAPGRGGAGRRGPVRKTTNREVGDKGNQAGQEERDMQAGPPAERGPRPPHIAGDVGDDSRPSGWAASETPSLFWLLLLLAVTQCEFVVTGFI